MKTYTKKEWNDKFTKFFTNLKYEAFCGGFTHVLHNDGYYNSEIEIQNIDPEQLTIKVHENEICSYEYDEFDYHDEIILRTLEAGFQYFMVKINS